MSAPLDPRTSPPFPILAPRMMRDQQLRRNVRHATEVIRGKREVVVNEVAEWELLRRAGEQIRAHTLQYLPEYLERFEQKCAAAGGVVHWARDGEEACAIVIRLLKQSGDQQVLKIKSMTSEEIGLNAALQRQGIAPVETDLAELIIQLGHDRPSHIVVPSLHKNRKQVRELFQRELGLGEIGESPEELAAAARQYLRQKFLTVPAAVSGANFLIAETGGVCVVESEGNGRMCLTLPQTLITIAGIDKVLPRFRDLEVMLQLLPRSATGERMNPYNSIWTGVTPGDGPQHFHVILLDNHRSEILADRESRQTLHCIRCGACQNVCPVYRQTGGHAYGSVYAGPIGAILTPQLMQMQHATSLPYASTLCGACFDACPVRINIPEVLIHLRHKVTEESGTTPEQLGMRMASLVFQDARRFRAAQWMARRAAALVTRRDESGERWLRSVPGPLHTWMQSRDLQALPPQTFREWWQKRGSA